jgi:hypothetical protein
VALIKFKMIISLTQSKHAKNITEVMFSSLNGDWFTILLPSSSFEFVSMEKYYIGKDFYSVKNEYRGKIFTENDLV